MNTEPTKLSIRIDLPNSGRFGPGKAALLKAIHNERSISGAARSLNMSYPRALKLIAQMNDSFACPLVHSQHGGSSGGGADLTQAGLKILKLYHQLCIETEQATQTSLSSLTELIKEN